MLQIDFINLQRMRNSEHFQFMTDVDELVTKYSPDILGISSEYADFKIALAAEDAALRIERGSQKSGLIENADNLRDKTWRAIDMRIEATLLSPIAGEVVSAQALIRTMDLYGDPRPITFNEESGVLSNLISDLLKPENVAHLNLLGMFPWVEELKKQNDQFKLLMGDRNIELSVRPSGDVHAQREIIEPLYEEMTGKINASLKLNQAKAGVEAFVCALNEKISYYENTLSIRRSRSAKKTKDKNKGTSESKS